MNVWSKYIFILYYNYDIFDKTILTLSVNEKSFSTFAEY